MIIEVYGVTETVDLEFDPAKDEVNVAKHGLSLAEASRMSFVAIVEDHRFAELRYRIYGMLDGKPHCLAATLDNHVVRAISLRRAHAKEYGRHVG